MARTRLRTAAIASLFLSAPPAVAAPNAFWIFGFDPPYGYFDDDGAADTATAGARMPAVSAAPPPPADNAFAKADPASAAGAAPQLRYAALDELVIPAGR